MDAVWLETSPGLQSPFPKSESETVMGSLIFFQQTDRSSSTCLEWFGALNSHPRIFWEIAVTP